MTGLSLSPPPEVDSGVGRRPQLTLPVLGTGKWRGQPAREPLTQPWAHLHDPCLIRPVCKYMQTAIQERQK
jgi:hypothetical protein